MLKRREDLNTLDARVHVISAAGATQQSALGAADCGGGAAAIVIVIGGGGGDGIDGGAVAAVGRLRHQMVAVGGGAAHMVVGVEHEQLQRASEHRGQEAVKGLLGVGGGECARQNQLKLREGMELTNNGNK